MGAGLALGGAAGASVLTRAQRDALTPEEVIAMLREGNLRFRSGTMRSQDFLAQKRATVSGQNPAAVVLSCIDSRAPAEIIMDTGIGEIFNARVAGNVATPEILGSMEYACAVAGAKLVVVMGHTKCGAMSGAIGEVRLGNLTGLLERIRPAIDSTPYAGERDSHNYDYVNLVAHANVLHTVDIIRKQSPVLAGLESKGAIKIVGAMYDIGIGRVAFMA